MLSKSEKHREKRALICCSRSIFYPTHTSYKSTYLVFCWLFVWFLFCIWNFSLKILVDLENEFFLFDIVLKKLVNQLSFLCTVLVNPVSVEKSHLSSVVICIFVDGMVSCQQKTFRQWWMEKLACMVVKENHNVICC